MASLLCGQLPSRAQGVCYFIDASGQTINLEHLCQSGQTSAERSRQPPSSNQTNNTSADPRAPSSEVTSYTIIRPVATTPSSSAQTSPSSTTRRATSANQTTELPIPNSRTTRIKIFQNQDFTITTIDEPDRVINGVLVEGRDRTFIGPGVQESSNENASD